MIKLLNISKAPSYRMQRVAAQVKESLSFVLNRGEWDLETSHPLPITITNVKLSADLRIATVYVTALGQAEDPTIIARLAKNKGYLRKSLSKMVQLKFAPDLRFVLDQSLSNFAKVEEILKLEKLKQSAN